MEEMKNMSVKVNEWTMVCPGGETPRRSLRLSRLDEIVRMPYLHTNVVYLYLQGHSNNNNHGGSKFLDTVVLKDSLSRVLVHFYPLAGRLRENDQDGKIEIECNAQGVLFIEAETPRELSEFGDDGVELFKSNATARKMLIPSWDYSKGLSSIPLLMVRFTRFKCGGVFMGVAIHHHICDGTAYNYFMDSWSRVARGLDLRVSPVFDRSWIHQLAPRSDQPPQAKFRHVEYEPPLPPLPPLHDSLLPGDTTATTSIEGFFSLTKPEIAALYLEATSDEQAANHGYTLSTYEVLAAHVWRCVCKVRALASHETVKLLMPVDARSRLTDPTPPKGYFGNLVFFSACIANAGDIMHKPLWYAASKIHEALVKMKDVEYLKSANDYLESQPNPIHVFNDAQSVTCPNLLINSWIRMPSLSHVDYGWGPPTYSGNGGARYEGLAFLVPTPDEIGGVSLIINLFKVHMPLFSRYWYNFKTVSKM